MTTFLKQSLKNFLLGTAALSLAGCFGGGTSAIDTGALTSGTDRDPTAPLSVNKLDNIEGTIGYAMDVDETVFESSSALTSGLSLNTLDGTISTDEKPSLTMRKNFIGGVDMNFDGRKISLREQEAVSNSDDAWFREYGSGSTKFSLSLWNAGKGDRNALTENEAGQNYHKIIGYDASQANGQRQRGHAIFGQESSLDTVADLERTATFDGYFSANIIPQQVGSAAGLTGEADVMSGGIELTADFDANTISGSSTNVLRRPAGDIEFREEVFELEFEEAQIRNNNAGGVVYSGNISSTFAPINGAEYSGTFYGDQAQETAGVLRGNTDNGDETIGSGRVVDGFFSAAR